MSKDRFSAIDGKVIEPSEVKPSSPISSEHIGAIEDGETFWTIEDGKLVPVGDDPVSVKSLSTESLTATESVDLQTIPVGDEGSSLRWAQFDSEVNSVNYRSTFKHAHIEVPADTSTEIVDVSDGDLGATPRSAFVLVSGRTPVSSDEFFDVVAFVHNESPDVISTNNRSNVPSRSYSATGSTLSVTVTDEKAAIAAIAIAGGADANP